MPDAYYVHKHQSHEIWELLYKKKLKASLPQCKILIIWNKEIQGDYTIFSIIILLNSNDSWLHLPCRQSNEFIGFKHGPIMFPCNIITGKNCRNKPFLLIININIFDNIYLNQLS